MKRERVILGGVIVVLLLVCGVTNASKWRKSSGSSEEEEEPPDFGAIEKEAYMKQLQYEFEMREQNPFLCLPKYLCIVQSETGKKKTAVLSSLRPVPYEILEQQENSGGPFPFPVPLPPRRSKPTSDSEESKEKEFEDSLQEDEDINGSESNENFGLERDDILSALAMENAQNPNATERPGVMGKLKTFLKPSFKLPSLPSLSMPKMPSLSLFKGSDNKNTASSTHVSSSNLLKRMQQRRRPYVTRMKRQAETEDSQEGVDNQEGPENRPRPRTPEQCQLLFKGCELTYEEIMKIAANGQVVVEKDAPKPPPPFTSPSDPGYARPPQRKRPIRIEDDELDVFLREQALKKIAEIKKATSRPNKIKYYSNYHPNRPQVNIPGGLLVHELRPNEAAQFLYPQLGSDKKPLPVKLQQLQHAQEFLTQDSKYGSTSSFYNQNKRPRPVRPLYDEDEADSTKIPSVGLPILPIRFQWGRPVKIGDKYVRPAQKKKPGFQQAAPAPYYTTTTQPPPIFSKTPVDFRIPQNIPIFANRTHQAILKAKPYHPFHIPRVKQFDKFGRPVSYASVFTEVAGSSGGVHDYFDKIASTIGENIIKTEQDLKNSKKRRVSRRKKNRLTASTTAKPLDSDEDKDITKEEDDPEDSEEKEKENIKDKNVDEKDKEGDSEKEKDADEEEEDEKEEDDEEDDEKDKDVDDEKDKEADKEEEHEDDEDDDTGLQDNHKNKDKYDEEKEIISGLPPFLQHTIKNDRIRRKNNQKKKKKAENNTERKDEEEVSKSNRRRGEPSHRIEYSPISIRRPQNPQRKGFFSSIYNMMSPSRNGWMSG